MVQTKIYETGRNYTLSVVPLFILMGNLVTRAGMSQELFRAAYAFIGHLRGGLAMATVWASAGFGGICGSSIATAATMAKVAYPSMKRFGYSDQLAAGTVAGGGHARHHDPAVDHHGDLRRLHRDQYRQALRGRDPARHPRRRAALPRHRSTRPGGIRTWGPPGAALVLARALARPEGRVGGGRAVPVRDGRHLRRPLHRHRGRGHGRDGRAALRAVAGARSPGRRSTPRCSRARAPPPCCS